MTRVRKPEGVVKTAVSLPAVTFSDIEAFRRKTGRTRSQVYADALRAYLRSIEVAELEARYEAGYKAHPEDAAEIDALLGATLPLLPKEDW